MPIWLCNPDILSSLLLWFSVWSSKEAIKVIEDYFTENILQYLSLLIHCVKWILNLADPKSWQNHNYSAVKINIVIHNVPFIYSTLIKRKIEWRMAYRENTVPRLLLLRQGVVVRPKRTPLLLPAVSRTARILNVSRWALSPTVGAIKPAIFPFQLSLINYSSAATSAFPPQHGMDTTICPRELGPCRICQFCLDCPSELWITQEPVQGTKVSALLWEHSTRSYWNIHPTSIQHQNSQVPAEHLSKERFSNASLILAYNKEKGKLFSLNSLRILQMLKLLWRPALNNSASPSLEFMKGQDPDGGKRQKETPTSRITQTVVIQMRLNVCGQYPAN